MTLITFWQSSSLRACVCVYVCLHGARICNIIPFTICHWSTKRWLFLYERFDCFSLSLSSVWHSFVRMLRFILMFCKSQWFLHRHKVYRQNNIILMSIIYFIRLNIPVTHDLDMKRCARPHEIEDVVLDCVHNMCGVYEIRIRMVYIISYQQ